MRPFAVFQCEFFISHKRDIIFAWPCKYSAINLRELTHTCGYNSDLVYTHTHIHYCHRPHTAPLAARIRISISSNFPLRSFHVATMCHRTEAVKRNIKWPVVYLCNTQLILRSYFFSLSRKFQFCSAFTSDAIQKVARCNVIDVYVVCVCVLLSLFSFACQYF